MAASGGSKFWLFIVYPKIDFFPSKNDIALGYS